MIFWGIMGFTSCASAQTGQNYRKTIDTYDGWFAGTKGDSLMVVEMSLNGGTGGTVVIHDKRYQPCQLYTRYIASDTLLLYSTLYYRQDEGRIYCLASKEANDEELLMDFSLNINDEIMVPSGRQMRVVEKRDSAMRVGISRILRLESVDGRGDNDIWLEGQGSLKTGLMPSFLVREMRNPTTAWITDYKYAGMGKLVDTDFVKSVLCEPMPVSGDMSSIPWKCRFEGDTLCVTGYSFGYKGDRDMFLLFVHDSDVYIQNIPHFSGSMAVGWKQHDLKFSGFASGQYNVHYNKYVKQVIDFEQDLWTEVFVESFIDTTLMCQAESASVPDIQANARTSASPAIYDLTGRRLTAEPTRGIYIRDGKKVMRK